MNQNTSAGAPYRLVESLPDPETYCHLRRASGLSPKSLEAAARGLPNSIFGVSIELDGEIVGMGRLIGDGGTAYQVVDIAVLPEHQGKGLGKRIMAAIADHITQELDPSAYVSLIADGPAKHLYAQFGFAETAPASVGMARRGGKPQ